MISSNYQVPQAIPEHQKEIPFQETSKGNFGYRVVKRLIASLEAVLSKIVSLFKSALTKIFGEKSSTQQAVKTIQPNSNGALSSAKEVFKSEETKGLKTPNQLLLSFYRGDGPDSEGRWLKDIWAYSDYNKETKEYIQWLFPSQKPSDNNAKAPVLSKDPGLVERMRNDSVVMGNLKRSLEVMLDFYGLSYDSIQNTVSKKANFDSRATHWIKAGNHNFLRITRILGCLVNFGLKEEARAFLKQLEQIKNEHPKVLNAPYTKFWAPKLA